MKTIVNGWSSVLQLVPYDQSLAQQSLVSSATGATPFRLLSHALDQSKVVNLRAAMHAQRPWVIFPDAHGHSYGSASPHGHGRSNARGSPTTAAMRSSASPVPVAGRRAASSSPSPVTEHASLPPGGGSSSPPGGVSFGATGPSTRAVPPIALPPVHSPASRGAPRSGHGHGSIPVPSMPGGDALPQPAAGAVNLTPRTRTISGSNAAGAAGGDVSSRSGKAGSLTPSSRSRPLPRSTTVAETTTAASTSGSQPGAYTPRGGRRVMAGTASASPTGSGRPPSGRTHTDTMTSSSAVAVSTTVSSTMDSTAASRPSSRLASVGVTAVTPKQTLGVAAASAATSTSSSSGALPSLTASSTAGQSGGVKTRVGTFFRSLIGTSGRTSLSSTSPPPATTVEEAMPHTRPPPRTSAMMLTVTHPHTTAVPSNARPSAAPGATLGNDSLGGGVDLLRSVDRVSSGVRRVYTAEGESTTVFTDTHGVGDGDRETEAVSVHSSTRNGRTGGGAPRAAYTRDHTHATSDADVADGSSGGSHVPGRHGGLASIASWILSSSGAGNSPNAGSSSRSPASSRYGASSNVHARVGGHLASKQSASEALDGISLAMDDAGGVGRSHTHARGQGDIFRRLQRAAFSQFIAAGGVITPDMLVEEDETSEAPLAYDETASGTSAVAHPLRRVGGTYSEEGDDTNARTRHRILVHRGSDSAMP